MAEARLPRTLRPLEPLFRAARLLGFAPFTLAASLHVMRSKMGSVLVLIMNTLQIVILLEMAIFHPRFRGSLHKGPGGLLLILRWSMLVWELMTPLSTLILSNRKANISRCDRLLRQVSDVEYGLRTIISSQCVTIKNRFSIVPLSRCSVLVSMGIFTISEIIQIFLEQISWKVPLINCLYAFVQTAYIFFIVFSFFGLALVVKFYFDIINMEIWFLRKLLNKHQEQPSKKRLFSLSTRGLVPKVESESAHVITRRTRYALSVKEELDIAGKVKALCEVHFHVQQILLTLQEIFSVPLLMIISLTLTFSVNMMYFLIAVPEAKIAGREVVAAFNLVKCAGSGLLLAWIGGKAAGAGGHAASGTVRSLAALLAAVRKQRGSAREEAATRLVGSTSRSITDSARTVEKEDTWDLVGVVGAAEFEIEKQISLFLRQLPAQDIHILVGGIFPLDLRFFLGLLGTTVGYVVIAMQFGEDPFSPIKAKLACNCSCS